MDGGGFVILTWDGGGNVPPALALAARLSERGHRVRVMAPASLAAAVASSGATHVPYRTAPAVPPGVRHEDAWPTVFEILNGPTMIDDVRTELERDRADV